MQCKFGEWWWTSVSTSPAGKSSSVTLVIHRPDGEAAGKNKEEKHLQSILKKELTPKYINIYRIRLIGKT